MFSKVVHITPVYPPYAGGIGVVAQMMAEGLAKREWDVEVLTPKVNGEQGVKEGKGVKVNYLRSFLKIGNAAVVPHLRKLDGYEIIHLHFPFFGGAEWLLFNKSIRSKKTKLILQYHHDADAGGLKGLIFKLYDAIILPRLITYADKVIVSSMDYARHSRVAKFISDKFVEILLGVDTERFKPNDSKFQIPNSKFTILFVGSLDRAHWFKGLGVLLNAIVRLKKVMPTIHGRAIRGSEKEWRCIVIGDGDLRLQFEKQARELGIAGHIQFLGKVPHDQLPEVYRNADCFVFPSVSRAEAFGLVVLEAMASGLPVVISDLPGVRTLVNRHTEPAEGCGFTFPVGDSIKLTEYIYTLMDNKPLREQMGIHARQKVLEQYSLSKMMDNLGSVYRSI